MLMDMFYDTIYPFNADNKKIKRRVHYHDFMLEVHHLIHEAKKSAPPRDISRWDRHQPFDPIPPVGNDILSRHWLLCLGKSCQVSHVKSVMSSQSCQVSHVKSVIPSQSCQDVW